MNKYFSTTILFFSFSFTAFSQIYNDGGIVSMGSTAIVAIDGAISNANGGQISGGGDIYVSGNWNNATNSAFTCNSSTVHLNGLAQSVNSGGDAFYNLTALTLAPAIGNKTLNDNTTVKGTLALTNTKIITQTNILTIDPGGIVVRSNPGSSSNEYVLGTLRKTFSAAQKNQVFEVGTASIYSPADISFAVVSSAGVFTVKAIDGQHQHLSASLIDPTKHSNMYWNIVNGGVIYSGSSVIIHHNGAINGGSPASYIVKQFYSNEWSTPDLGNVDATSAGSINQSYSGDFVAGEIGIPTVLPCQNCIPSFSPEPGRQYVLSAWVKESGGETLLDYTFGQIKISFPGFPDTYTGIASGNIIDGWQRIEKAFTVPASATGIKVELLNTGSESSNKEVFFDDVRIHPFDASMKSFVYDPETLRLSAELDNNNYATFYEYDEDGALVRVKKETERGVMTIKESKNNTVKK